jgi:hypothetical protein
MLGIYCSIVWDAIIEYKKRKQRGKYCWLGPIIPKRRVYIKPTKEEKVRK